MPLPWNVADLGTEVFSGNTASEGFMWHPFLCAARPWLWGGRQGTWARYVGCLGSRSSDWEETCPRGKPSAEAPPRGRADAAPTQLPRRLGSSVLTLAVLRGVR